MDKDKCHMDKYNNINSDKVGMEFVNIPRTNDRKFLPRRNLLSDSIARQSKKCFEETVSFVSGNIEFIQTALINLMRACPGYILHLFTSRFRVGNK